MKRRLVYISALSIIFIVAFTGTRAQNIVVKLYTETGNPITVGSSTLNGYQGQSEIFSFGQASTACAGNTPACVPVTGNFIYNLYFDATLTDYQRALYNKLPFRKVEITFLQTTQQAPVVYYQIVLDYVTVTGIETSSDGTRPTLQIKLDPQIMHWYYKAFNSAGVAIPSSNRTFGWDRTTNMQIP